MMTKRDRDILIVGAGITGLMAASVLGDAGLRVTMVDKGRSVGGRLATRRIGPGRADHGAQFFTVRSDEFGAQAQAWLRQGWIFEWARGWSDGSQQPSLELGHPRFAAPGGMNSLAKHLAAQAEQAGCVIAVDVTLRAIEQAGSGWRALGERGESYLAQAVLLTPPVPQTLALLAAGEIELSTSDRTALEAITYAPSLCGLFWVEGTVNLPEPGVLQIPTAPVSWVADNQRKGISPEARLLTAQANPHMSQEWWALPEAEALTRIQAELHSLFEPGVRVREAQLKRWRYALATSLYPAPYLALAGLPSLVVAGDAFGGPRVEGAALSGLAAGAHLTEILSAN